MGFFQCFGSGFGKTQMADLAFRHELGHSADRFLDRDLGVNAVLVEKINSINT